MVKILFFGTADISKIFLENLFLNNHQMLVITKPDSISNRGQKLHYPQVKSFSIENNIPFIQIQTFDENILEKIKDFNADVGIAVSFGKLIPPEIFNVPKLKTFNIHFSLLPKYRGAAPVQYAIFNGEKETGVCAFYIEKTLDSGDIIVSKKVQIDIEDTAESLFKKLIPLGIETMNEVLDIIQSGNLRSNKQIGNPSFAPILKREDAHLIWNRDVIEIYNRIRGLYSSPGAYSIIESSKNPDRRIKIIEAEIIDDNLQNKVYGNVSAIIKNKGFVVDCLKGSLLIKAVQPENKPKMKAWDFVCGRQIFEGDLLK
jgi:methionyl-tRNA formyltransferase